MISVKAEYESWPVLTWNTSRVKHREAKQPSFLGDISTNSAFGWGKVAYRPRSALGFKNHGVLTNKVIVR